MNTAEEEMSETVYAAFTSLKPQPEGGWVERYECGGTKTCMRTDIVEAEVDWTPIRGQAPSGPPLARRKCPDCGYGPLIAVKGEGPAPGPVLGDFALREAWDERTREPWHDAASMPKRKISWRWEGEGS